MDRVARVTLVVYLVLVGSLATPLYDPFQTGRDDSWAVLVVAVAAHLIAGFGIARWWVVAMPAAFTLVVFFLNGAEGLAWLLLIFGMPTFLVATLVGLAGSRVVGPVRAVVLCGLNVVATAPGAWALADTVRRGEPVPASVQAQLPTSRSLTDLCPGERSRASERKARRQAAALLRELRLRPHDLVTYTYTPAEEAGQIRRDITVRELAEEQLKDLDSCDLELERRLRAAL